MGNLRRNGSFSLAALVVAMSLAQLADFIEDRIAVEQFSAFDLSIRYGYNCGNSAGGKSSDSWCWSSALIMLS